jgi:hypothetical protein
MKKLFIIAFSLILTMGATDMSAQSLMKKFGDAVKKEIKKEVKKEVDKAVDKAAKKVVDGIKNQESSSGEKKTEEKKSTEKKAVEKSAEKKVEKKAEEQNGELVRRPYREETVPHSPKKWAPHTAMGQKQAEEARVAKFEYIQDVDLYFNDGSIKDTHKLYNDGEGYSVQIKDKYYKVTPCNEDIMGMTFKGYCTYLSIDLYIKDGIPDSYALSGNQTKAEPKATFGTLNGHDWVDLGLPSGTKWATCNIGATAPEKPGNLYAWGESVTKSSYSNSNYSLNGKYVKEISGDKSLDTATKLWGDGWRMPTHEEFNELLEYCEWAYTEFNGRIGAIMTSTINRQSIFLPAGGSMEGSKHMDPKTCGGYWIGTAARQGGIYLWIYGAALNYITEGPDYSGQSIRPVTK